MKSLILFILFSIPFSLAQVKVHITDPHMKVPKGKVKVEKSQMSSLPSRESRDQFFQKFPDFQKQNSAWDELERDFFFDDLRRLPASDLTKKYPTLSPALLNKMSVERKK